MKNKLFLNEDEKKKILNLHKNEISKYRSPKMINEGIDMGTQKFKNPLYAYYEMAVKEHGFSDRFFDAVEKQPDIVSKKELKGLEKEYKNILLSKNQWYVNVISKLSNVEHELFFLTADNPEIVELFIRIDEEYFDGMLVQFFIGEDIIKYFNKNSPIEYPEDFEDLEQEEKIDLLNELLNRRTENQKMKRRGGELEKIYIILDDVKQNLIPKVEFSLSPTFVEELPFDPYQTYKGKRMHFKHIHMIETILDLSKDVEMDLMPAYKEAVKHFFLYKAKKDSRHNHLILPPLPYNTLEEMMKEFNIPPFPYKTFEELEKEYQLSSPLKDRFFKR